MLLLVGTSKWLNVVQLLFRVKKLFAATPTPMTGTVGTQTPVTGTVATQTLAGSSVLLTRGWLMQLNQRTNPCL